MNRYLVLFSILLSSLFFSSGCQNDNSGSSNARTIDAQFYSGRLVDAELSGIVDIVDRSSTISVLFADEQRLSAEVQFTGELRVFFFKWHAIDDFTEILQNIERDGNHIRANFEIENVSRRIEGDFTDSFRTLDINIEMMGTITLTRQSVPVETSDDEASNDDDSTK